MSRSRFHVCRDAVGDLFDVVSYGRRGPTAARTFTPEQLAQLSRTVNGTPEVMVKVSGGARDAAGVVAHVSYIGRKGDLEVESDGGEKLAGKGAAKTLLEDWDLDLYTHRIGRKLTDAEKRCTPKLAHNLVLSMPRATDGQKVLAAARAFARDEFALKHRYAMVLHTDTPHPHVHLVVKAESEEGPRLYIRKATLRRWREEFARHLRDQGIAANATPRAVRGYSRNRMPNGLYRVRQREASSRTPRHRRTTAEDKRDGKTRVDDGRPLSNEGRQQVISDWKRSLGVLVAQRQIELALQVARFVRALPPAKAEKEVTIEQPKHEPLDRSR